MLIYYSVTITANIVAAFVFYKSINITVLSTIPLFLNNRMNSEDSERREQERKEELGKWK